MTARSHRHDWQQSRVFLEQKGGRAVSVTVAWKCAGRNCKVETFTRCSLRKPRPDAAPRADDWMEAYVKRNGGKAAARRRQTGFGSLAAAADAEDLDDDLDFAPVPAIGGGRGGTPTPEDIANWHEFLSGDWDKPAAQEVH